MQREGKGKYKEVSFPEVHDSTLRCDAVSSLMWPFNGTKSAVMGCLPHYLLLWERPELLIALFPMMRVNTRFRQVPAYVVKVRSGFHRGRIEARRPSKNKRDGTRRNYDTFKSTVKLMPGDGYWTKLNPFQGERKIDSQWDEVDYEIACQVANARPRMRRKIRAVKWRHPTEQILPSGHPSGCIHSLVSKRVCQCDPTTHSAPSESTPLECDIDMPRNNMDGVRQPLFEVVLSTATKDNRDGRRDECASDDEPHWVPPVYFQARNLEPNSNFKQGGERLQVRECWCRDRV